MSYTLQGGEQFFSDTMARLTTETDAVRGIKDADLVIEAIVENIDVKCKLFSVLDKAAPRFATTIIHLSTA